MIKMILMMVMVLLPSFALAQSSAEYTRWKNWCRSIDRIPAGTPSNPICLPGAATPVPVPTPSAEEIERREKERIKKENEQKAAEADRKGLEAAGRGDWKRAINFFFEALKFAPESELIRTHLFQARDALTDKTASHEMTAIRQRIEDALSAAEFEAFRQKMEDEIAVRQLETLKPSLTGQNFNNNAPVFSRPVTVNNPAPGGKISYPFSSTPIAKNGPPGRVLETYQSRLKSLDQEIERAQKALRNLIRQNSKDETERLEWLKRSEEATLSAQDLSISLVLDLVGAHLDLDNNLEINRQERQRVLDRVLSRRAGEQGSQVAYGILINRQNEILRSRELLKLAKKENELIPKIRDFSMTDTRITWENVWDVFSQFEIVDKLAGPSKNLVDAAYTVYKQAASLEILAITLNNQERTYRAAEKLQNYIKRLVAQKKSLSTGK